MDSRVLEYCHRSIQTCVHLLVLGVLALLTPNEVIIILLSYNLKYLLIQCIPLRDIQGL